VKAVGKGLRSFGHFWLDFLIGDTPEIFLGTLVVVAAALLLRHDRAIGITLVLVLSALLLMASTYRGRRRRGPADRGERQKP
jgi:uncharacterized membrane protein (UPF0136 family)